MSLTKANIIYTEYRNKSVREFGYNSFVNALSQFVTRKSDKEDIAIIETLKKTFTTGGQIVIWGAGARGRRLIKAIEQKLPHIVIKQVVDSHLSGKCFSFSIQHPEKMMTEDIGAVVVATLPQKQDITNLLRNKALAVI